MSYPKLCLFFFFFGKKKCIGLVGQCSFGVSGEAGCDARILCSYGEWENHHHGQDLGQVVKHLLTLGSQALFSCREGSGKLDTWRVRCFPGRRWPISSPEFYQEKSPTMVHHSRIDVPFVVLSLFSLYFHLKTWDWKLFTFLNYNLECQLFTIFIKNLEKSSFFFIEKIIIIFST